MSNWMGFSSFGFIGTNKFMNQPASLDIQDIQTIMCFFNHLKKPRSSGVSSRSGWSKGKTLFDQREINETKHVLQS